MNQHPTTNASCTADTKCVCRMECPPGTHQQWRTSDKGTSTPSSCTPCPVAHYQDEAGKSFCKFCRSPCLPGTYTDSTGAKICACKECPGGKYMDEFGQRGCKNCVPGRYHPLSRQTTLKACNNCSTGSYTDRPGMIKCVKCPIDTDTDTMSLLQRGASSLGDCKQCADNKTTGLPRFSSVRSVEEIPLEMSFRFRCSATPEWLCNRTMEDFKNHSSSLSSLSSSSSSGGCYKSHYGTCERKMCKNKDEYHPDADRMHLLRYVGFPADACHVAPVPINPAMTNYTCKSCRGEHCEYGTCTSEGYKVKTGCKECQQGWYKYDFNTWSDCTKCDANNPNQGIIEDIVILLFATYLLLSTLYVLLRTEAEDYVEKREQMQSSSSSSSSSSKRSKLSSSKDYKKTPLVAVLPLLHQIQMTSVLIVVVQPPLSLWTTTVQFLLKVLTLDLTSFFTSIQCSLRLREIERWYMSMAAPVSVVMLFAVWFALAQCRISGKFRKVQWSPTSEDEKKNEKMMLDRIILRSGAIVFLSGVYIVVVRQAFQIFNCDGSDFTWTAMDGSACPFAPSFPLSPFNQTESRQNNLHGFIAIGVLAGYGLLPFVLVNVYVLSHRQRNHRSENVLDPRQVSDWASHCFGWIMRPFRVRTRWWEILILVHKFIFVAMITINLGIPGARLIIVLLFLFVSIVLHLTWRPYKSFSMNVTWVMFDLSHMMGLLSSIVVDTPKGMEFGVDFFSVTSFGVTRDAAGDGNVLAPSPSSSSLPFSSSLSDGDGTTAATNTNTTTRRRSLSEYWTNTRNVAAIDPGHEMSFIYMVIVVCILLWMASLILRMILAAMEEHRQNMDENTVAKGGTFVLKDSTWTTMERRCLSPLLCLWSFVLLLLSPLCLFTIFFEIIIRAHLPFANTPCWNFDIGNFGHIVLLDELRIMCVSPIYIVHYALRRSFLRSTITFRCGIDHEKLKKRERKLFEFMYQKPWSKKIRLVHENQIKRERLQELRQEYKELWVSAKMKGGRVYYYSRANPNVRKWKIPKMSWEEERVRAYFEKKDYEAVILKIGGKEEWKKLSWKHRLKALEKEKKEEKMRRKEKERAKRRPKPPPRPPTLSSSTKVVPFANGVADVVSVESKFELFLSKNREKKIKKKAKKKKEKKKAKKQAAKLADEDKKKNEKQMREQEQGEYDDY